MWHQGMLFKVEHPSVVIGGIWWQSCEGAFCGSCELDYMGTLYCVRTCVTFHSANFPWWQGAQWLVLFTLLCVGVHTVLPNVLPVNVRCLFIIFKEGAGSGSLQVADMFCTKQTCSSLHIEVAANDTENIIYWMLTFRSSLSSNIPDKQKLHGFILDKQGDHSPLLALLSSYPLWNQCVEFN